MKKIFRQGFEAPLLDLEENFCARYSRISSRLISGEVYVPSDAWDLSKNNSLLRETDNYILKQSTDILIPGSSVITFYDPSSGFNEKNRIVTHAMLYLGKQKEDLWFAEQRVKAQQIISLRHHCTRIRSKRNIKSRKLRNLKDIQNYSPHLSKASCNSGLVFAYCFSVCFFNVASTACLIALAPATLPFGCPLSPPPA